ncbi:MAG: thioesterase [Burkholderiaceae bacterium]|nr:thioesterase [Burkholderiaceae bacterium]
MNHCEISQIFFRETYNVPAEQTVRCLFRALPHGRGYANGMINAMATGYLVAVLESICVREMQPHLERDEETVVGSSVKCRHRAPIPPGALLTINGWVVGIGDREATFWVQASDEQEVVCEGEIRFAIVRRSQIEKKIQTKCDAIERRELFVMA